MKISEAACHGHCELCWIRSGGLRTAIGVLAAAPSTPGYCCDYDAPTMRKALDAAEKGEEPKKRDQLISKFATRRRVPARPPSRLPPWSQTMRRSPRGQILLPPWHRHLREGRRTKPWPFLSPKKDPTRRDQVGKLGFQGGSEVPVGTSRVSNAILND